MIAVNNSIDPSSNEALSLVLEEINDSVTDFEFNPAQTALDVGSSGDYPLHKVAIWGDIKSAEVLLTHGADIDAPGEDNDTPLHRAVMSENPNMIRFLLSMNANANLKNRYGDTPLEQAVKCDYKPIIDAFGKGGNEE